MALTQEQRNTMREEFYHPATTEDRMIEILKEMSEDAAGVGGVRRCVHCHQPLMHIPHDKALIKGQIYSDAGINEVTITGLCEFCFDEITKEPDEEEPDHGTFVVDL